MAVRSRRMLRSVIYLLFVLTGVAGLFFLIDYNFLAAIQLTVYAGGIVVLIIFSVLLVHHIELRLELSSPVRQLASAILCLLGIGLVLYTVYNHEFPVSDADIVITTADVGNKLLHYEEGGFILPFEVISVLLLAAMIGGIVIAKGRKLNENSTS